MKIIPIDIDIDLNEVKKVVESSFSETQDSLLEEWFSFLEMEKMIREDRGLCLKAVSDDGDMVGIIYAQQESPINGKEGIEKWVIVVVGVDQKHSGKGLGSFLLKELEERVKGGGVKNVYLYQ